MVMSPTEVNVKLLQLTLYSTAVLLCLFLIKLYYNYGGSVTAVIIVVILHSMSIHWRMFDQENRLDKTLQVLNNIQNNVMPTLSQHHQEEPVNETREIENHIYTSSDKITHGIPTPVEEMNNDECDVDECDIVPSLTEKPTFSHCSPSKSVGRSLSIGTSAMSHRKHDGHWKDYDSPEPKSFVDQMGDTKVHTVSKIQNKSGCGCSSETAETEVKARVPTELNVHSKTDIKNVDEEVNVSDAMNQTLQDDNEMTEEIETVGNASSNSAVKSNVVEHDLEVDGPETGFSDESPTKALSSGHINLSTNTKFSNSDDQGMEYMETLAKEVDGTDVMKVKTNNSESGYHTVARSSPNDYCGDHHSEAPQSLKEDLKEKLGIDLRVQDFIPYSQDEAALSLRDVGSNESYRWNNLPSNSFDYDDIPEDAFHMVQSNATGNRQIYEELKRINWVMGYFSQGDSIEVYINLDGTDPAWYHQQLCYMTGQPENKFRIVDNEHKWSM